MEEQQLMKLGEKIKTIRKNKDYTLKQLSEITGLSIGFLSNIERDLNSPSINNLQQICSALGINLMEILDEEILVTLLQELQKEKKY